MLLVIKGTSTFWDPESLRKTDRALGDMLLSVFHTLKNERYIENQQRREQGLPELEIIRIEGLINSYVNALSNEIHSLAIIIDTINFITQHKKDEELKQKHDLFIANLVENYYRNLRSIFDFISVIYRVVLEDKFVNNVPSGDSFNETLKFIKKGKAEGIIPRKIIDLFLVYEDVFLNVKKVRDYIVHKGKELTIYSDKDEYYFTLKIGQYPGECVLDNILNIEKDIFPLLPYLSKLTNQTLEFLSDLGVAIFEELSLKRDNSFSINLSALEGVCIPGFIRFLALTNEDIVG
ncbi:hypothetical protein [Desulfitobacterium hafniense]|uniref:Cthe-2314-like HEPN domain-containing protein n=1 Tax=Desulfitobacterium hafniense (strain Y51) TaxID=138119 RepID=Q24ZE7_DESHY|nr:hypothetical protein [Desulfitobacterium hafniense]BAE82595.1 hypothetical protein DSY0806 [Desulfitobacterium hafniense Y51]